MDTRKQRPRGRDPLIALLDGRGRRLPEFAAGQRLRRPELATALSVAAPSAAAATVATLDWAGCVRRCPDVPDGSNPSGRPARSGARWPAATYLVGQGRRGDGQPDPRRRHSCSSAATTDISMRSMPGPGQIDGVSISGRRCRSPVFGDGVVAVADRNGVLHGVDGGDGQTSGGIPTPVVNMTAPVLADGIVYITGTDHKAHGFDLQTGAERWSWTTEADLSNALAIGAGHRLCLVA